MLLKYDGLFPFTVVQDLLLLDWFTSRWEHTPIVMNQPGSQGQEVDEGSKVSKTVLFVVLFASAQGGLS